MFSVLNGLFLFCSVIFSLLLFCLINQGRTKDEGWSTTGCLKKTWTFFEIDIIPLFIKESFQNFVCL